MRKIIVLSAIALVAAAPAMAQQKSSANDRAMAREAAMAKKVAELFNKKDAAGLAALYTSDGIFVAPTGQVAKGHAAIEAAEAATIKAWGDFTFSGVAKEAGTVGNGSWGLLDLTINAKGPSGAMTTHSHSLNVLVREGKEWKIAVTSVGSNVAPPGAMPQR